MSLELNKIAAAVLTGGVIAMGSGFIADLLIYEDHLEESVYRVAGVEEPVDASADAGPALEPVLPLLAAASVDDGEGLAKKCVACHSLEKGGANKVGPALWGVVGRKIGGLGDYSYSSALQEAPDEAWTYSALNGFLANPKEWAPGTKMSYAGISDVDDRAAMIVYLRSLSDDPQPLPSEDEVNAVLQEASAVMEGAAEAVEGAAEAVGEAAESAAAAVTEAVGGMAAGSGISAMLASADPANGEKVARKCAACHSFDEGGPNKVGPALWDVVGREIGGHEGYSYSKALSGMAGKTWDYEALAGFLANPKEWAPGTKMSYAGIKKEDELADLIAYLRSLSNDPMPLPGKAAVEPVQEDAEDEDKSASAQPAAISDEERAEAIAAFQQRWQITNELTTVAKAQMVLEKSEVSAAFLVEAAKPDRGKSLAQDCADCHTWDAEGADLIGPNLFGVFGREVAALDGYQYSDCFKAMAETLPLWKFWSYQLFDKFLAEPGLYLSNCGGQHASVASRDDRMALAAYFRLQDDSPYRVD